MTFLFSHYQFSASSFYPVIQAFILEKLERQVMQWVCFDSLLKC